MRASASAGVMSRTIQYRFDEPFLAGGRYVLSSMSGVLQLSAHDFCRVEPSV